jgi:cyclopropane fatty-acyl-phospholipid synthase-like methyltransferase
VVGEVVEVAATALALPEAATARAQAYIRAARAKSTLRVYAADWRRFLAWCSEAGG